jgi:hypothetical protein
MSQITIAPQPGFQVKALSCPADILICGAVAGCGKTFYLLCDPLRYYDVHKFNATIIRRTFPQIMGPGGLWDKSEDLYPYFGAKPIKSDKEWRFPKSRFVFRHLQNESDWEDFQGSSMCYIGFDELTQFNKKMFFTILGWNRSECEIKAYVRATCNPDPDSFVAELVDWYIGDDGFPLSERDGVIRYFIMVTDEYVWGNSKEEVYEQAKFVVDNIAEKTKTKNKFDVIKSFSFIKGNIEENQALLSRDPGYVANLMAMSEEEQMRYLQGNWKVKLDKEILFKYANFMDCFTNYSIEGYTGYITADIATTGRDFLVISYWKGKRWEDIEIIDKNNGKQAIEAIYRMKEKYHVTNSHILFDADGVGNGMTGWIANCVEFHGNKRVIGKQNYKNLKSQCFYELSYCINQKPPKTSKDLYYISKEVAEKQFPYKSPAIYNGRTVGFILQHQMKAIRELKPELGGENKLGIIPKDEQKSYIQGISPDFIEQMAYREYFEIGNTEPIKVKIY